MVITIELTPEKEKTLLAEAKRRGLSAPDYVRSLVEESLPTLTGGSTNEGNSRDHFYFTATEEEFEQALDNIAKRHRSLPMLSPSAYEREFLYADEDEIQ